MFSVSLILHVSLINDHSSVYIGTQAFRSRYGRKATQTGLRYTDNPSLFADRRSNTTSPHGGYTRQSPYPLYGLPPPPPASSFVGAGDLCDANVRRMCAADRGRKLCTHKLRLSQINAIDLVRALLSSFKAQTADTPYSLALPLVPRSKRSHTWSGAAWT